MFRIGIIGAGWIAHKMTLGIAPLKDIEIYAIASRSIEKAKELMLSGYKIYEAAQMVGFDDVSYFSRVFKKYEGCSPREYEKK